MRSRRSQTCSHRRAAVAMVVAALALAGCANSYDLSGAQRRSAKRLVPGGVQAVDGTDQKKLRTLKVRVYADQKYRVQVLRWQRKFEQLVDRSNRIIAGLGVQLEVVSAQPWQRESPDNNVFDMVRELQVLDPGDDVDWVIGLATALPEVSSSFHQLGAAQPLSKHFVVRATNDAAERKTIDAVFTRLDDKERAQLYLKRKTHKELVVFLHEWAHTLGAMHESDTISIMYPSYDPESRVFSAENRKVMEISLRYRRTEALSAGEVAEWYAELATYLRATTWRGWEGGQKAELLTVLDAGPQTTDGPSVSTRLTPAGRREFLLGVDYLEAGKVAEAWRTIEPLTEQYDDEPSVLLLGCRAALRAKGAAYPAPKLCERAAALAPTDASPLIAMARAHFAADDREAGLAWLRKAHVRLESVSGDEVGPAWLVLAQEYQQHTLVTWTEQALAGATAGTQTTEIKAWAAQIRSRYGLPPGGDAFGIPPTREGEYIELVKKVLSYAYGGQYDHGRLIAKQALATFPKGPGLHAALCDLELRVGRAKTALGHCRKALSLWDGAMWAHYLTGTIAAGTRRHDEAIGHLERAVELDPSLEGAWQLLHREYGAAGKTERARELERLYRARFGKKL